MCCDATIVESQLFWRHFLFCDLYFSTVTEIFKTQNILAFVQKQF